MARKLATRGRIEPTLIRRAKSLSFPAIATDRARRLKRFCDVVLSIVALVLAFPLFALIAVAILLESGGPVLFRQERIGRGNSRFLIYKFRTMTQDASAVLARHFAEHPEAEQEWCATRKLRKDPRITRVGRLLRRTSLDELPQLWNIIRGDMSIAGPRPIVEGEVRQYGTSFPLYALARPGLTGLWQVSGRNDTTYRRRVELDTEYVRNWSLRLDGRILLSTVGAVLRGTGAY